MSSGQTPRTFAIVAGLQRSGKTYHITQVLRRHPGSVIAYNVGRTADFEGYTEIEFLDPEEAAVYLDLKKHDRTRYLFRPVVEYFRVGAKVFHMSYFTAFAAKNGRRFKHYGRVGSRYERALFQGFALYLTGCAVVFDDARPIFRAGLSDAAINLFSRQAHTGKKARYQPAKAPGVDIFLIFHNLDRVNGELYDYATHLVMFRCNQKPSQGIENKEAQDAIFAAYDWLLSAPRYSRAVIPLQGDNQFETTFVKP